MGRRVVRCTPELLVGVLSTGNEIYVEVVSGLPEGAELVDVVFRPDISPPVIEVVFQHPDWPEEIPAPNLSIMMRRLD